MTRLHGAVEVAARLQRLAQVDRLVTVLGTCGHGKTRLAVAVAHALVAVPHPADPLPGDPDTMTEARRAPARSASCAG